MAFEFAGPQPVMNEPFRPTVFMGREIAVDRDEIPSFTFDADAGPDFSDSDPGDDADAARAFNQEVLADAQNAPAEHSSDEDGSDDGTGVEAVTNDAIDLLKQHDAAAAAADDESSDSGDEDIPVDDTPEPEPEVEAEAVDDKEDKEDHGASPASPKSSAKKPAKSPAKAPAKKTAKPAAKAPAKAIARPTAKAAPRQARKPKKELPLEKPTRISDRISKPRARAAAQTTVKPQPAASKPKASRKKAASKAANDRKTSGQQWEVDSIVDSMIDADTHQHFYEVKWKGFSSKDNTWEPKINLANCQAAIRQFEGGTSKRGKRKSS